MNNKLRKAQHIAMRQHYIAFAGSKYIAREHSERISHLRSKYKWSLAGRDMPTARYIFDAIYPADAICPLRDVNNKQRKAQHIAMRQHYIAFAVRKYIAREHSERISHLRSKYKWSLAGRDMPSARYIFDAIYP